MMSKTISFVSNMTEIMVLFMAYLLYLVSILFICKTVINVYYSKIILIFKEIIFLILFVSFFKCLLSLGILTQYLFGILIKEMVFDFPIFIIFSNLADSFSFFIYSLFFYFIISYKYDKDYEFIESK